MEQSVPTLSVIEGDWKYIVPSKGAAFWPATATETGSNSEPQLYNLAEDIGGRDNIAAENPDKVKKLAALIEKVKATPKTRP